MVDIKKLKTSELLAAYECLELLSAKYENDYYLLQGRADEKARKELGEKKMKVSNLTNEVLRQIEEKLIGTC